MPPVLPATNPINALVLLGVTQNSDNYGVRVLLSAATEALAHAGPGAEIAALDYGPAPATWKETLPSGPVDVHLINLRFSWKIFLPNNGFRLLAVVFFSRLLPRATRERLWRRNPWLRQIADARAFFSIAGGDSFSDIYALRRFLYVILPQVLVILMQRPLIQLPQTYGPFKGAIARCATRWILRRSRFIYSRDEAGVGTIRELLPVNTPPVTVVPDIGLGMSPQPLPAALAATVRNLKTKAKLVGINVSSLLYMGGYSGNNMFGLRDAFPALIETLVAGFVAEPGTQVLLIPHVCGGPLSQEDETRLCQRLAQELRPRFGDRVLYLNHPLDHREIKSLIGQCELFIGARMHACVAAVSQGVPAVCLAYSGKFAGVMAPLGKGARVVDLRIAGKEEVLAVALEVWRDRRQQADDLQARLRQLPSFAQRLATDLEQLG